MSSPHIRLRMLLRVAALTYPMKFQLLEAWWEKAQITLWKVTALQEIRS